MNRGQDGDHLYTNRGGESLDPSAASCVAPASSPSAEADADADTAFQVEVDRLAALIHDNNDDNDEGDTA